MTLLGSFDSFNCINVKFTTCRRGISHNFQYAVSAMLEVQATRTRPSVACMMPSVAYNIPCAARACADGQRTARAKERRQRVRCAGRCSPM